ncbi:uncharacterized protein LOC143074236 [Mytilus galloprovincialis]|uniref:uncharacterized protein LOC143074236 n=1 Tax=Mytilus galloprovincialis TaxID=29158 RepID=UPI003F7C82FB
MKFVATLLYVGAVLVVGGKTEFPCKFPDEWVDKTFVLYEGSPPALSAFWTFESDGITLTTEGAPTTCYQITDQFYVIRDHAGKFECFTIDFTPAENNFTVGDKGNARVINPLPSGAFNETVLCNLCSEATTKYLIAIAQPVDAQPTDIIPIECDVPYFCTSGTGNKCAEPLTTTKTPMTTTEKPMPQRKKSCSRRKRHS